MPLDREEEIFAARGELLKGLISRMLEGNGGMIFAWAKGQLVKLGCAKREDIKSAMLARFDKAAAFLKTLVAWPEMVEDAIIAFVRNRVVLAFDAFADKACVPQPVAGSPAPGEEIFGSAAQLQSSDELFGEAFDPTLPE